mmetsp:Transcript_11187/g.19091  ORF Transcript_11187/g.19091 Transcript_11187/m.19091 type:complete len:222 (+) Transcript_11187:453-1118(+)
MMNGASLPTCSGATAGTTSSFSLAAKTQLAINSAATSSEAWASPAESTHCCDYATFGSTTPGATPFCSPSQCAGGTTSCVYTTSAAATTAAPTAAPMMMRHHRRRGDPWYSEGQAILVLSSPNARWGCAAASAMSAAERRAAETWRVPSVLQRSTFAQAAHNLSLARSLPLDLGELVRSRLFSAIGTGCATGAGAFGVDMRVAAGREPGTGRRHWKKSKLQ